MAGIYAHIPFCKQACHYCDFHFSTDLRHVQELVGAIGREVELRKEYFRPARVETIYFGGGTPSLLEPSQIQLLMDSIHQHFVVIPDCEITMEVNPDDLTREKIASFRKAGINRLSIGVQSFNDDILKYLNRAHNSAAVTRSLDEVRKAGFDNVSIDLIYAIPGLTDSLWSETLLHALRFSPEHISAYALTIEDRTVFGNLARRGKLAAMDEDHAAGQYEMLMDHLGDGGFEHYEISNFCKPGLYSQHNSNYWKDALYLGIGPGAHSYDGRSRQFNVRNNALYVRAIGAGQIPGERELLTRSNQVNEFILTRLRTMWGCNLTDLKTRWNDDLVERAGGYISKMEGLGLLQFENQILRLTNRGKLVADKIASDLMLQD